MVGKKKPNQLGRSLIKDRFSNTHKRKVEENMLHAADLNDGYDWARLNLNSVVEEDTFQDFLRKAELAGTEFAAEKLNIKFVNPKSNVGILTATEKKDMDKLIKANENLLKIPRRPKWTKDTSLEELNANESRAFLEWRRDLSLLQENENLVITPYEKNLEFWRQLWRVIERSDVLVQIVDARNPLLFRSEDLEKYVKEVDPNKQNILLLNKADFLTDEQREIWAKYFDEQNLKVAFFSALEAEDDTIEEESEESDSGNNDSDQEDSEEEEEKISLDSLKERVEEIANNINEAEKELETIISEPTTEVPENQETETGACSLPPSNDDGKNNSKILTRLELIEFFRDIRKTHPSCKSSDHIVIGLMGYPNVGKSSTINALLQAKKVSVSATPGKTKHFQTLYLDREIILCDCCGLVLPSFCYTKADMILNGILPIDQMRDHVPPINTLCTLIPRHILEDTYGILITKPMEGEDPDRPPHSEELLLAYGYNRGYMTANGQPDQSRSARRVLKDFVNGKLLYCYGPPTTDQNKFHEFPERTNKEVSVENLPPRQQRAMKIAKKASSKDIDDLFFQTSVQNAHVKGRNLMGEKQQIRVNVHGAQAIGVGSTTSMGMVGKKSKAPKREKREKLRRKYAHLDQH
ncbi:large subunit GTPase 1 homolog [Chironomus tepperi]|uniref:large subunit GTPase 1 homolog n=1 Tax=Chironomus tepperi TaxID=113505 RepID=UPI00391F9102